MGRYGKEIEMNLMIIEYPKTFLKQCNQFVYYLKNFWIASNEWDKIMYIQDVFSCINLMHLSENTLSRTIWIVIVIIFLDCKWT